MCVRHFSLSLSLSLFPSLFPSHSSAAIAIGALSLSSFILLVNDSSPRDRSPCVCHKKEKKEKKEKERREREESKREERERERESA